MNNVKEKASTLFGKCNDTNFSQVSGKVHIFPFIIRNGYVNVSERGFEPKGANPYFFSFFQKVFTGSETITATWENSTQLNVRNASLGTYNYDFQVGTYYEGMIIPGSLTQSVDIDNVNGNESFLAMQESSEITIAFSRNELEENSTDFIPTEDDLFKLYIIPETKLRNKWLYISNVTTYVNPKNESNILTEVTFSSLKDKLEQSGRALEQYVQYAAPGEPYAFPYITEDGEVKVSPLRLWSAVNPAVKYLQVELQGASALSSITILGRRLYWDALNLKWYTSPSKFLFPYKFVIPQANPLNKTSAPTKNFYCFPNETVQTRSTSEWINAAKAVGTELAPQQNMGAFTMSGNWNNGVHCSNSLINDTHHYDYNDAQWKPLSNFGTGYTLPTIATNGNVYCSDTVVYNAQDSLIQILIKNSMCNIVQLELPLDMQQTRPYRWSNIPVIGFWTRWFGDRAVNQNTTRVRTNHICYFIDTNLATLAANAYVSPGASPQGYGNLQMFTGDNAPALLNPQSANTTFCFQLTDKVSFTDNDYVDPNNHRPMSEGIDTVYLSQKQDEYGDYFHNDHSALLLNCTDNSIQTKYVGYGFVIDSVIVNALHIGKIKVSCFTDGTGSAYGACDTPIFTQTVLSNSMFEQNNIRNWTTNLTLGCWDSNWSNGDITWPLEPQKDIIPSREINAADRDFEYHGQTPQEHTLKYDATGLPTQLIENGKYVGCYYENVIQEDTIPYAQLPGDYNTRQDFIDDVNNILFSTNGSFAYIDGAANMNLSDKYLQLDMSNLTPDYKLSLTQTLGAFNMNDYNPLVKVESENVNVYYRKSAAEFGYVRAGVEQIAKIEIELTNVGLHYKITGKTILKSLNKNWDDTLPMMFALSRYGSFNYPNHHCKINFNKILFIQKQTN